jgi:CheY-like chemotaxis protein
MKEITEYLIKIEKMAGKMYDRASAFFKEDKEFAHFLGLLAEDESYHLGIMASADLYFKGKNEETPPFIALDEITKEKIERPLIEAKERLQAGNLTKEDMIGCIVSSEFSEWNHVFLYVVNTLRHAGREFEEAAVHIQEHKKRIEKFLDSPTAGRRHLEIIRALPSVWTKTILIVIESEPIVNLLAGLFENAEMVETATDQEEALKKTKEHYFDAIIADADIWGISGLEFYKRAAENDPGIGERFLFLTGFSKPGTIDFLIENNLRHLIRPLTVDELRKAVNEVMARGATPK